MTDFKVGDKVTVKVDEPVFGWGSNVNPGDVGVVAHVLEFNTEVQLLVDFPGHKGWEGLATEFRLVRKCPPDSVRWQPII